MTHRIPLKYNKLNDDLLAYLRAHCLLFYQGTDTSKITATEPTDIDYESFVLKAYRKVLDRFKEVNLPQRFSPQSKDEIVADSNNELRKQMIEIYRYDQCKIIAAQYSIVNTILMLENQLRVFKSYSYAISQLCLDSDEHFVNLVNMRLYLKQLFAPDDVIEESKVSSESESEGQSFDEEDSEEKFKVEEIVSKEPIKETVK